MTRFRVDYCHARIQDILKCGRAIPIFPILGRAIPTIFVEIFLFLSHFWVVPWLYWLYLNLPVVFLYSRIPIVSNFQSNRIRIILTFDKSTVFSVPWWFELSGFCCIAFFQKKIITFLNIFQRHILLPLWSKYWALYYENIAWRISFCL